jgi:hypothetical protein
VSSPIGTKEKEKAMKQFRVYKHPTLGFAAVKVGFSWPAFFFNGLWMLVKQPWTWAGMWFVAYGTLVLITAVANASHAEAALLRLLAFLLVIAYFTLLLVPGLKGNKWCGAALIKRGYNSLATVEAKTPAFAIIEITNGIGLRSAMWRKSRVLTPLHLSNSLHYAKQEH